MYSEAPDEVEFREAKGFDLKVLVDLDHDPLRLTWLVDYTKFMAKMGKPLTQCPSMYKVRFSALSKLKLTFNCFITGTSGLVQIVSCSADRGRL